jgi:hypothetical protein
LISRFIGAALWAPIRLFVDFFFGNDKSPFHEVAHTTFPLVSSFVATAKHPSPQHGSRQVFTGDKIDARVEQVPDQRVAAADRELDAERVDLAHRVEKKTLRYRLRGANRLHVDHNALIVDDSNRRRQSPFRVRRFRQPVLKPSLTRVSNDGSRLRIDFKRTPSRADDARHLNYAHFSRPFRVATR